MIYYFMNFSKDEIFDNYYQNEVKNSNLEKICDSNNLFESSAKCRQGVAWKESVQRYQTNELQNIRSNQKSIRNGTYKQKPMVEFQLNERGHTRDIKSHHISDRVVQNSLNNNLLIPQVRPKLIYDNGASLKDKGLSFTRKRFEIDLRNAYKQFGDNGWILFIDFSKYFDNINHQILLNYLRGFLNDDEFMFVQTCFSEFEIDVSYMTDEEYATCMDTLFNSLEYVKIDKFLHTGEKMMKKSVGIGSQTSQISGLFYPHEIDNYCKIVKSIKYYGRYMDDTYIIMNSKEELMQVYNEICAICARLGIFINHNKTRIQNISSEWLTFLKINYKITQNGGLIKKVQSVVFHREYRRITKFHRLYTLGKMTLPDIIQCYLSWRGTYVKFDSGYDILNIDNYFKYVFNLDKNFKLREV